MKKVPTWWTGVVLAILKVGCDGEEFEWAVVRFINSFLYEFGPSIPAPTEMTRG